MKALILMSGGLDSTTVLAIAKASNRYESIHGITINYGQRHVEELDMAKQNAKIYGLSSYKILNIPLSEIATSSLTNKNTKIPSYSDTHQSNIPNTYVPARNTVFLSLALSYAESNSIQDIYVGANEIDYSGYPDCRKEFFDAFENMANLAIAKTHQDENFHISIHTPLLFMSKKEIIAKGLQLGVEYKNTISCYDFNQKACGKCDACYFRLQGFTQNNIQDPAEYWIHH